jgi:hypothetical protein
MARGVASKKAEKPLVVFLRLYGADQKRLKKLCTDLSRHHNDIAMGGLLAEMLRLERMLPDIPVDVLTLLGECLRLGIPLRETLQRLIADAQS